MNNSMNNLNQLKKNIDTIIKKYALSEKDAPRLSINGEIGIFLIHGFGDSSYKMKYLYEFLSNQGFSVYSTTIPTLCGKPLKVKYNYKSWIEQVKEELMLFKKLVKKIVIIGFSTGATIAINIIESEKDNLIDALVLISPALFFVNRFIPISFQILIMKIYSIFCPVQKRLNNTHLIYMDQIQRKIFENREKVTIKSVTEVLKLAKETKKVIKDLKNLPILIAQPVNDIVVSKYGSELLSKKLMRSNVIYKKYYKSGHPLVVDTEKDKLFNEILSFINNLQ